MYNTCNAANYTEAYHSTLGTPNTAHPVLMTRELHHILLCIEVYQDPHFVGCPAAHHLDLHARQCTIGAIRAYQGAVQHTQALHRVIAWMQSMCAFSGVHIPDPYRLVARAAPQDVVLCCAYMRRHSRSRDGVPK